LITSTTTAMTKRMWMYPPSVYELTNPSNHRTNRITKIVQSISHLVGKMKVTGASRGDGVTRGLTPALTLIQFAAKQLYSQAGANM